MSQFTELFDNESDYVKSNEGKIVFNNPNFALQTTEYRMTDFWPKKNFVKSLCHLNNSFEDESGNNNLITVTLQTGNTIQFDNINNRLGSHCLFIENTNSTAGNNGVGNMVRIIKQLTAYGSFSFCFWSKFIVFGNGATSRGNIFQYRKVNSGNNGFIFYRLNDTQIVFAKHINGVITILQTNNFTLETNVYYFFVIQKERINDSLCNFKVFINNILAINILSTANFDLSVNAIDDSFNFFSYFALTSPFNCNGFLDEILFFENTFLEIEEIEFIYNLQQTKYFTDKPYITNAVSLVNNPILEFQNFSHSVIGSGLIGYNVSIDDGATWLYWNGSEWTATDGTGTNYNTATTLNANLSSLDTTNNQIKYRRFFISDGDQSILISQAITGFDSNQPPNLIIGSDLTSKDKQANFKPFFDTVFNDPDGSIAKAEYKINGGSYIEIAQGSYGTLLEAVQEKVIEFDYNDGSEIDIYLKITDNEGKETEDYKTITIELYQYRAYFKDIYNNQLKNLEYKLEDKDYVSFDYYFDLFLQYSTTEITILVEKLGFQTEFLKFTPISDSINNYITMTTGKIPSVSQIQVKMDNNYIEVIV
jgi:hypothetical protein